MDEHLQQLLTERHEVLMTAVHGINERLDAINGRIRQSENHIAVLHDRQKLLWGGITAIGAAGLAWIVDKIRT